MNRYSERYLPIVPFSLAQAFTPGNVSYRKYFFLAPSGAEGKNSVRNNKLWPLKGLMGKKNDICFLPPGVNAWARENRKNSKIGRHFIRPTYVQQRTHSGERIPGTHTHFGAL